MEALAHGRPSRAALSTHVLLPLPLVLLFAISCASNPPRDLSKPNRATPYVAAIIELVQGAAARSAGGARPEREGEERSRIESHYTEAEIRQMIAEAEQLPPDPNVQTLGPAFGSLDFSAGTSFESIQVNECCLSGTLNPPDPELAVGPDHVVAVVNSSLEIYDKSGTSLVGPMPLETFFSILGAGCTAFAFDPNALYDEVADRFVIAADGNGSEYCVGVSQTGDPTGAYFFYAFPVNVNEQFFDYPHAGLGDDAIYVGANMFGSGFGRVFAFEKDAMYAGAPAAQATHDTGFDSTPQPMNVKGAFPDDGVHYFVTSRSGAGVLGLYSWVDPFGADVFTDVIGLDLASHHGASVAFGVSSPQSMGPNLNSLDPRPLDFEYRDGSGWTTNLVSCNPGTGTVNCVQWAEIDVATATIVQAGVFGTHAEYRIFPDLAIDACGNLAVGFTKTNGSSLPGVWIAGRRADDPAGTLQGEIEIKAGERGFVESRWGDYSGLTADPDGVTLWYLGEYANDTAPGRNWGTYVGSVSFDGCEPFSIFTDGFESSDTSAWSTTVP